jgi:hypothetical protein
MALLSEFNVMIEMRVEHKFGLKKFQPSVGKGLGWPVCRHLNTQLHTTIRHGKIKLNKCIAGEQC